MVPVNCIQFSYLGITRYVICDLDTRYEQMQELVAITFHLPEEFITAIQFTDGKGYFFNKDIFEYFLILFPQPEQKFYVRLDCSKIIDNRIANNEAKALQGTAPLSVIKDTNKRKRRDMQEIDDDNASVAYAAPVIRQNCFLGSLPGDEMTALLMPEMTYNGQPRKRIRLMKSTKKPMKNRAKPPQPKRALRL